MTCIQETMKYYRNIVEGENQLRADRNFCGFFLVHRMREVRLKFERLEICLQQSVPPRISLAREFWTRALSASLLNFGRARRIATVDSVVSQGAGYVLLLGRIMVHTWMMVGLQEVARAWNVLGKWARQAGSIPRLHVEPGRLYQPPANCIQVKLYQPITNRYDTWCQRRISELRIFVWWINFFFVF